MAKALIVHTGFSCPGALRERGEKYRGQCEINYGTARFGPEATDPGGEATVAAVVTNDPGVAEYWAEKDVTVEAVSTLPDGFPARGALAEAHVLSEEAAREAAAADVLQGFDGIGDAKAKEIKEALGLPTGDEEG